MAAEKAFDTRELAAALNAPAGADAGTPKPLTINDLPKEILVSIFIAVDDLIWVRHTFPRVCKWWNEIYLSKDASPLHETLEVDFKKEVRRAWEERLRCVAHRPLTGAAAQELAPYRPAVHASRVIAWAQRHADSVCKLLLDAEVRGALGDDFSAEEFGRLVAVVGSSLTEIWIEPHLRELIKEPFWESLRELVVPAAWLRSLVVRDIASFVSESAVEPLERLSESLEELVLETGFLEDQESFEGVEVGLPRFPEFFCSLTELGHLSLIGHPRITALPANIASLKKLETVTLWCDLSSLPKELGELSRLTSLDLSYNIDLGGPHEDDEDTRSNWSENKAFPAELGKLKSLRRAQPPLLRPPHRPVVCRQAEVARGPRSLQKRRPADRRPARLPGRGLPPPAQGEIVQRERCGTLDSGLAGAPRSLQSKVAREKPKHRSVMVEEVRRFPLLFLSYVFLHASCLRIIAGSRDGAFFVVLLAWRR